MRDDETESYREEQGKPPRADPRERQAEVPLAFSSGGVLASGADEPAAEPDEGTAGSADATGAVERAAAELAAERRPGGDAGPDAADQARPSRRS
jgi:hypothetical protein